MCDEVLYASNLALFDSAVEIIVFPIVNRVACALLANPFESIVKNVPVHLQRELVDLQCDGDLKSKFAEVPLVKFYGEYNYTDIPHDKCPSLVNHARMLTALFGSTLGPTCASNCSAR